MYIQAFDRPLITISSQTQDQDKRAADKSQVMRQKSCSSSFRRAFTLPGRIDVSDTGSPHGTLC
jgi:HSP20 family molecular chaperone IbpA